MVKKIEARKEIHIKFEKGAQYFLGEKKLGVKERVYASPSNIKVSSPMACT